MSTPVVKCPAAEGPRATAGPVLLHVEEASTFRDAAKAASLALAAGFDGVEWLLPSSSRDSGGVFASAEPAAVSADAGVKALAVRCAAVDPGTAARQLIDVLAVTAALGAGCLNVAIPPLHGDGAAGGFARYQDALNFAYELFFRLRWEAESRGVLIALEAASGGCLLSPSELRDVIDAVNSWAIGVCVDGRRIPAVGLVADWCRTLGRRVHCVRILRATRPAAVGALELQSITHLLDEINCVGPVVFHEAGSVANDRSNP